MLDQVILLTERLSAERLCLAPLSLISAALARRPRVPAEVKTASCRDWTISSGPFVGPSRSRQRADEGEQHKLWGKRAITMDFIWAKQKSAMGLA
jgi:sirohydrochlorin ferrochelatase